MLSLPSDSLRDASERRRCVDKPLVLALAPAAPLASAKVRLLSGVRRPTNKGYAMGVSATGTPTSTAAPGRTPGDTQVTASGSNDPPVSGWCGAVADAVAPCATTSTAASIDNSNIPCPQQALGCMASARILRFVALATQKLRLNGPHSDSAPSV